MKVHIPQQLYSYTKQKATVELQAGSLQQMLLALDKRFAGIRFRVVDEQNGIREHVRFFVNGEMRTDLKRRLSANDEVYIICAISGG